MPSYFRRSATGLLLAAFAFLTVLTSAPHPALAKEKQSDGVQSVIDAARKAGVSIIVLDGAAPAAAAPAAQEPWLSDEAAQFASTVSIDLNQAIEDVRSADETVPAAIGALSPDGRRNWPLIGLAIAVLSLLAGWAAEQALLRYIESRTQYAPPPAGAPRSDVVRFIALDAILRGVLLAAGFALALLAAVSLTAAAPHERTVVVSVFESVAYVRGFLLFFRAVLTPPSGTEQLVGIPREEALALFARMRRGLWLTGALAAASFWLSRIHATAGVLTLAGVTVTVVAAVVLGRAAVEFQHASTQAAGERAASRPWLKRYWHLVVVGYLCAAVVTTAIARLVGAKVGAMVVAPVTAAILAAVIYTLSLLVVDGIFGHPKAGEATPRPTFRRWAERSSLVIACTIAASVVLAAWGVGFFRADGTVRPIYTIVLFSIVSYIGWLAIHTAFDRRIAREIHAAGPNSDEMEEGGVGGTRLATLLPLFRNAILIAIMLLAFMVVLSAIGVNVAPLFAGAGLIGIAIGFGAQTLVRDIFSGVFFLVDDAFRVGEYIVTGKAKGTVEKISIRSMQLRHQNGPLHTIPFGEIKELTNFSRDWVIMKLPIRVRFGTDTERVRKLIKQLGQELLQHPDVGKKFVEPLKSQGVYQMDEFGIVTRIKFKTRPGDQFAVRRVVYQKINELFEREGIAFGGREVLVRAADESEITRKAVGDARVAGAAADIGMAEMPGEAKQGRG